MTTHYEDEAQVEQLRRWWKENWMALALGLALGLGAIFGWQAFGANRDGHRQQAARLFGDLKKALTANKSDDAQAIGKKLVDDYTGTPYAASAQLSLAAAAVLANRLDEAQTRLQWVVEYESSPTVLGRLSRALNLPVLSDGRDEALLPLARLRLARVLWQLGKNDDALAALDKGAADAGDYAALYDELRGDILLLRGDRGAAHKAYAAALAAAKGDAQLGAGLQDKLDAVADAATQS